MLEREDLYTPSSSGEVGKSAMEATDADENVVRYVFMADEICSFRLVRDQSIVPFTPNDERPRGGIGDMKLSSSSRKLRMGDIKYSVSSLHVLKGMCGGKMIHSDGIAAAKGS